MAMKQFFVSGGIILRSETGRFAGKWMFDDGSGMHEIEPPDVEALERGEDVAMVFILGGACSADA